jgi:hypothetical protein
MRSAILAALRRVRLLPPTPTPTKVATLNVPWGAFDLRFPNASRVTRLTSSSMPYPKYPSLLTASAMPYGSSSLTR